MHGVSWSKRMHTSAPENKQTANDNWSTDFMNFKFLIYSTLKRNVPQIFHLKSQKYIKFVYVNVYKILQIWMYFDRIENFQNIPNQSILVH